MDLSSILQMLGLLMGGGGVGCILTSKYTRMQAAAEAKSAESEATKSVQDVYQEMIADVKADRAEQKQYIVELKEDRNHLRQDRDELRKENEQMRTFITHMQKEVVDIKLELTKQGRKIEIITPFLCIRKGCNQRLLTTMSDILNQEDNKPKE